MTAEELDSIWEKQIRKYIMLGFNDEVKLSEGSYRRKMPRFLPQPESYIGRFDIPLIIDPRISLKSLHKLIGIHSTIIEDHIVDVVRIPQTPYTIWTHDANRYRMHSVKDAIGHFQPDELPSPLVEVLALYIERPEIFQDHGIDATGSIYGKESVPCINTFFGKPELSLGDIEHPDSRWGALSRGRLINTEPPPSI